MQNEVRPVPSLTMPNDTYNLGLCKNAHATYKYCASNASPKLPSLRKELKMWNYGKSQC